MRKSINGKLIEFLSKDTSFAEAFKYLFENSSDAICVLDKYGNFVAVNRKAEELTGLKRGEWIGKPFRKVISAKSLPKAIKSFLNVVKGRSVKFELELKTITKKTVPVEVTLTPLIIKGQHVGTIGIIRDMTEQKQMEEALRKEKEKFQTLFNLMVDPVVIVDSKGKFLEITERVEEITGYKKEELLGKNFLRTNIVTARSKEVLIKNLAKRMMGYSIKPYEVEILTKDGKKLPFEINAAKIEYEGKAADMVVFRDIAERKKLQKALIESEEKYRKLFQEALDAIFVADAETGIIVDCNRAACKLVGRKKSELIGKHQRVLHPSHEIEGEFSRTFRLHLKEKEGQVLETQIITKNGEIREVAIKANLLELGGKKLIQGIFRDITERKRVEKAIRESREKFERLFMDNPEAAIYSNSDFHILDVNPRFTKVFGHSLEEIKGKHINDVVVPKDKRKEAEMLDKKAKKGYIYHDTVRKRKNGSLIPVSISVAPIMIGDKIVGYVGLYKDITQQKQMEKKLQEYSEHLEELVEERTRKLRETQEQLLRAERLAAIGEIAAMVGHDLRNPLTGIAGATYYLKMKLGSKIGKKAKAMLELIEKNIGYSNNIINDLLEYSKEIRLTLTEVTPKSILKEALALIRIPENIQILDLTENKPKVRADIQKMTRVFVNIIKNAIEAMPKGGTLTIKSKKLNGNLEITFTDTGIGISKDVIEKIWVPLFTTKAKGMGLGLSICKRIIEAHEGNISVKSKRGKGTTFTITIPTKPELNGGEKVWMNVPESSLLTTMKA